MRSPHPERLLVVTFVLPLAGAVRAVVAAEEPVAVPAAPASLDTVRALIWKDHYADAEKMARELLAAAESTHGCDSVEAAEVLDLLVEALVRGGKFRSAEALELADRAISNRQTVLGPDHPDLSASLAGKGSLLKARGRYAEGRPLLERALALRETAYGADDVRVGRAHNDLGTLLLGIDLEGSGTHGREALRILEVATGPDSLEVSDALDILAVGATDHGRFGEAKELCLRSLRISEEELGPRSSHAAVRHRHLGGVYLDSGDYERAREELEQAVSIAEEALGSHHPALVRSLANLAIAEDLLGLPAAGHYERAIALADETMGPDHDVPARIRANYAGYLGDSDVRKARQLLEQAQAVLSRALGPLHPQFLWVTSCLGDQAAVVGDYAASERYFEQAIAGLERSADAPPEFLVSALEGFASCRAETGRNAEARALYERALALGEKGLGPDHPRVAWILVSFGHFLRRQGALGEAGAAHARALKIRMKAGGEGRGVADSLFALADVKAEEGKLPEALRLFRQAVAILGKTGTRDDPGPADGYRNYASCLLRGGQPRAALAAALEAEAISRRRLRTTVAVLSERSALSLVAKTPSGLDLAISAASALRDPASAKAVMDTLVRSRALVLDETGQRNRAIRAASDPELSRLFAGYAAARSRLANLVVKGEDESFPERHRRRLEEARVAKEAAERALAERSADFNRSRSQAGAGLAEAARALPKGGALVAFVRYARHESSPSAAPRSKPDTPVHSYAAFVVRHGAAAPVLVPLGPASAVDAQVALVRKALSRDAAAATAVARAAEASYRRAAGALSDLVWKPLESHLGPVTTVFLVPDGSLQLVSFAALPEGAASYLVEKGPVVHYLSAERDLVFVPQPSGEGLVAAGAPDFDERPAAVAERPVARRDPRPAAVVAAYRGPLPSCRSFDAMRFEPLPASEREVGDVSATWSAAVARQAGAPPGAASRSEPLVLTAASAGEAAVKASAPGRRVVHLATHGFFLGDCASAPGESAASPRPAPSVFAENPLLLSGLAFAGANLRQTAGPGIDDGILTAEEIAALDLSGVEWAVLSACETGVGELRAGEGLFGLRRAFQIAGARTLITSLWPVEDEASRLFMRSLYEKRLSQGMGTARAVHEASLEALRQRRAAGLSAHPFFWAGFVAAGDWR